MLACEDRTTGGYFRLVSLPPPEFQSYTICNSISTYGRRVSLGADVGFFQRRGCKYGSSRQTSQGQRNAGGGSVRVRVLFEYVEYLDFLYFAFRGINLRHYY